MHTCLRKSLVAIAAIIILSGVAAAQEPPLKSMSRPTSHLFEVAIAVEVPDELKDKPLQFQMPKWSPGRYAVFDFAKNVQEFRANAPVTRVNADTWSLAPQGKTTINVSYKV